MLCSNCKKQIEENSAFCGSCGTKLENSIEDKIDSATEDPPPASVKKKFPYRNIYILDGINKDSALRIGFTKYRTEDWLKIFRKDTIKYESWIINDIKKNTSVPITVHGDFTARLNVNISKPTKLNEVYPVK